MQSSRRRERAAAPCRPVGQRVLSTVAQNPLNNLNIGRFRMSLMDGDLSAAAQRFRSHLTAVASTRVLVPVSVLAAVSIAGVAGGLMPSTPGIRVSPARAAMAASADFALSARQAAHAEQERWQAVARRACEEMQEHGGVVAITPYGTCVRETFARWSKDSAL